MVPRGSAPWRSSKRRSLLVGVRGETPALSPPVPSTPSPLQAHPMSDPIRVWGAPEGWDAFLLAQRRREFTGSVLHVTRDDARMARLAEALSFAMPEAEILRFPAWDCLPYDRVSPNPALVSERIATLARLMEKPDRARIVLTT